jgi:3-hydroxyisobutyrate dehydrogenase-like beta-hydroxyacid dehydrogenase
LIARLCLLGFGEVGQTLAADLRAHVGSITAWDLKFADSASAPTIAAGRLGVIAAADARSAVAEADVVICAVTAAQIGEAAMSVAAHLKHDAYYFDLNSTSPAAKQAAAAWIDAAGGRFVEAAIMSPIAPRRVASPMLVGGVHAAGFLPLANQLGFAGAQLFSDKLGAASAAKMCRSVVIKGLEALMLESLLTARKFGVEQAVLDSLQSTSPADTWRAQGRYMISRALVHGRRRAEEMREAARTVAEAGFAPRMSGACAEWQEWAADHSAAANEGLEQMLDTLLAPPRGVATC